VRENSPVEALLPVDLGFHPFFFRFSPRGVSTRDAERVVLQAKPRFFLTLQGATAFPRDGVAVPLFFVNVQRWESQPAARDRTAGFSSSCELDSVLMLRQMGRVYIAIVFMLSFRGFDIGGGWFVTVSSCYYVLEN